MRLLKWVLMAVGVSMALASIVQAKTLSGELEGAAYIIRMPDSAEALNGKVLLLAHGYWPEHMPVEVGDDWGNRLTDVLVKEGWSVAFTSYRRNGWIMEDAARDLENLYELISVLTLGDPIEVYLMGDSMGGGISTLLAESPARRFSGVLAMGAYLFGPIGEVAAGSTELGAQFSTKPHIPILYLTNTSELEGPQAYVAAAASAPAAPIIPALWKVRRDGHVNLNLAEQSAALMSLVNWAETGEIELEKDATINLDPVSTAQVRDGLAQGVAARLVPIYGNFVTNFVREDLAKLGIEMGDRFELTAADMVVNVLMGESYGDVEVGDWVGFWDADGYLLICRNYKNATQTMGLEAGARVLVRALQ